MVWGRQQGHPTQVLTELAHVAQWSCHLGLGLLSGSVSNPLSQAALPGLGLAARSVEEETEGQRIPAASQGSGQIHGVPSPTDRPLVPVA